MIHASYFFSVYTIKRMDDISIDDDVLSPGQLQIVERIYTVASSAVEEVYSDPGVDDIITMTVALTKICGLMEAVRVNGNKLKGREKKEIVLYVGRALISDLVPDCDKDRFTTIYDSVATELVEVLITFAKANKTIRSITRPCIECAGMWC